MKLVLILAISLSLAACGGGSTNSGAMAINQVNKETIDRCELLKKQCRFSDDSPGCVQVKQTEEDANQDTLFFESFCS